MLLLQRVLHLFEAQPQQEPGDEDAAAEHGRQGSPQIVADDDDDQQSQQVGRSAASPAGRQPAAPVGFRSVGIGVGGGLGLADSELAGCQQTDADEASKLEPPSARSQHRQE